MDSLDQDKPNISPCPYCLPPLSVLTFRPGPGLDRGDGLHGAAGRGAEAAPSWGGAGGSCSWGAAAGPSCYSCRHPAAAQLRPLGRGQLVQVLDGSLLIPDNQGSISAISLLFGSSQLVSVLLAPHFTILAESVPCLRLNAREDAWKMSGLSARAGVSR